MSSPTAPAEHDVRPAESVKRQVEDEDKKSQKSSIERIQQFRDYLADYQVWFAQNEISREVSREEQLKSYHRMAQGLLRVLRPYLTDPSLTPNTEDANGNQYWNHVLLGEFTIDPPDVLQRPSQRATETAIRNHDHTTLMRADPQHNADPEHYRLVGLREFATFEPEWTVEWTMMYGPDVSLGSLRQQNTNDDVTIHDRQHRTDPVTIEKTARIPRFVVDNAVTCMENFIRDIGMDIEFKGEPYYGGTEPGI